MADPFKAKTRRRNGVREPVPTLPVARLSALGASPRVLQEANDRFTRATEEEQYAVLEEMAQLSDDELRVRIEEMEAELSSTLRGVVTASAHVPKGSIDQVTAWVGADRTRAQQAIEHERLTRRKPRQKLLGILEPLVRD